MDDRRRCTATSHGTGGRCKRPAIKGGTVCATHGGSAPQVKAKAAERLKALQDPAITRIEAILEAADNDQHALKAALGVLDRTGLGPHSTQDVNVGGDLIREWLEEDDT